MNMTFFLSEHVPHGRAKLPVAARRVVAQLVLPRFTLRAFKMRRDAIACAPWCEATEKNESGAIPQMSKADCGFSSSYLLERLICLSGFFVQARCNRFEVDSGTPQNGTRWKWTAGERGGGSGVCRAGGVFAAAS